MLSTYVDDISVAGGAEEVKKLFRAVQGSIFAVAHSQADCFASIFQDELIPEEVRTARVVTNPGQCQSGQGGLSKLGIVGNTLWGRHLRSPME